MKYGSVCSGIEAASVAWHPLGWEPVFFSEIEKFPNAVLSDRWPGVFNLGDMTRYKEWNVKPGTIDLLVGGTPCQSFSVAGLRKGMDDPRGNLALVFLGLAATLRPRWIVWENVPGVLSSNGGKDFGSILGGLVELGYGFAYRVLDAQYFGVPQRRRRVFVVGYLGAWQPAAAVLFERESMCGYPPPSREARKGIAGGVEVGPSEGRFTETSPTLDARCKDGFIRNQISCGVMEITHALRADGFDASEDGTGRGTPLVPCWWDGRNTAATLSTQQAGQELFSSVLIPPIAIQERAVSENPDAGPNGAGFREDGVSFTLEARQVPQAIAFQSKQSSPSQASSYSNITPTLDASKARGMAALCNMQVRRLTPRECERLQGFPDNYTLVEYRGKPARDGPRYEALGNSMAVPVMRWIGERIEQVEGILR